MAIERLVYAPQCREYRHVLPPARAKIKDCTLHVDDFLVDMIQEQYAGEIFGVQEQAQILEQLIVRDGAVYEMRHEILSGSLFRFGAVRLHADLIFRNSFFHMFNSSIRVYIFYGFLQNFGATKIKSRATKSITIEEIL